MTFTVGAQVESLGPEPSEAAIRMLVTSTLRDLFQDDRALEGSSEFITLRHYLWAPGEKGVGGGPNTIFSPGMLTGEAGRMLDQAWDGKVFFASAENAKNLRPRSTKPHYDLFGDENLPAYDDNRVLLPTSKPPFYSKYSDMRGEVGYMSGAMESGRYVAHEVAASLGATSALPARPLSAPRPALQSGARAPVFASELLAQVRDAVLAEPRDALCAKWAAGGEKFTTWLHDLVAKLALAAGHAEANDPRSLLAAVRDFAEHVGSTVESAVEEGNNEIREHLRAIDEHLNLR
jgi:monoamine oxidase